MKINNLGRLFRSQKGFNDTFAMISQNRFFDSKLHVWSVLHVNPLGGPPKNRKNAFLAKWTYFYPRWLYVKTSLLEGLFRSQKGFNDTFAMISLNRFFDSKIDSLKYFTRKSLRRTTKKLGKCDFSQMNKLLPPMIINENDHLRGFVPLPKRF